MTPPIAAPRIRQIAKTAQKQPHEALQQSRRLQNPISLSPRKSQVIPLFTSHMFLQLLPRGDKLSIVRRVSAKSE